MRRRWVAVGIIPFSISSVTLVVRVLVNSRVSAGNVASLQKRTWRSVASCVRAINYVCGTIDVKESCQSGVTLFAARYCSDE